MKGRLSAHHVLAAYGFNPWAIWQIRRGGLGAFCSACSGRGFTVVSPCPLREFAPEPGHPPPCTAARGCLGFGGYRGCRRRCRECRGAMLERTAVHVDDFGSPDDRAFAEHVVPGLHVVEHKRMDMHAPAL